MGSRLFVSYRGRRWSNRIRPGYSAGFMGDGGERELPRGKEEAKPHHIPVYERQEQQNVAVDVLLDEQREQKRCKKCRPEDVPCGALCRRLRSLGAPSEQDACKRHGEGETVQRPIAGHRVPGNLAGDSDREHENEILQIVKKRVRERPVEGNEDGSEVAGREFREGNPVRSDLRKSEEIHRIEQRERKTGENENGKASRKLSDPDAPCPKETHTDEKERQRDDNVCGAVGVQADTEEKGREKIEKRLSAGALTVALTGGISAARRIAAPHKVRCRAV